MLRALKNRDHFVFSFLVTARPFRSAKAGFHERSKRPKKCIHLVLHPLSPIGPPLSPLPDSLDRLVFALQLLNPFWSQLISLPAVLCFRCYQPFILKLLQRGIDRSRARLIEAAGAIR